MFLDQSLFRISGESRISQAVVAPDTRFFLINCYENGKKNRHDCCCKNFMYDASASIVLS